MIGHTTALEKNNSKFKLITMLLFMGIMMKTKHRNPRPNLPGRGNLNRPDRINSFSSSQPIFSWNNVTVHKTMLF